MNPRPVLQRPSIRQIEYLVALAETLHFGRAARRCAVTQPALSAQIRQLEELLGVQLFERSRRRVLLTPAGERIVDQARRALAVIDDVVAAAQRASRPLAGPLRLGVIPTVAPYFLPVALPIVRQAHPELELVLREEQTARLVTELEAGALDAALLALPVGEAALTELPLYEEPFVFVAPAGHPLTRGRTARVAEAALEGAEVLLLEDGHCLRAQALDICRRAGAVAHDRIQATSMGTLVQMVAYGLGVTLVPERAVAVEVREGSGLVAKRFREPAPRRTIGLAWRLRSAREAEYRMLAATLARAAAAPRRQLPRSQRARVASKAEA
jgi:LysR family transcriptional regulator, hydrogen peroxide-inducible genes activator